MIFLLGLCSLARADGGNIAITIDDLPFVGDEKNFHLKMIIEAFKANEVPATGFVIAGNIRPENVPILQEFRNAGLGLGNHTLTHANANMMSTDAYIQQIDSADKLLQPLLSNPHYFRYPYLATGQGEKKNSIRAYLASKHYQIAPITIDSKDFVFNQLLLSVAESERRHFLTVLRPCYLDFIWQQTLLAENFNRQNPKANKNQILLIHANLLNAYVLPDIINLYKQHGFNFISLSAALNANNGVV